MKKRLIAVLSLILALLMFASCGKGTGELKKGNVKIGVVISADENDAYAGQHISGINKMKSDLKLKDDKLIIKKNVTEEKCFENITALVDSGCNLIFSIGDGFEDYMVQSATENPTVHYCVANGTQAATSEMENLHSYSVKEFESRYVAGVAAGLKLNDLIDNGEITPSTAKIGYVGSSSGAENTSAYSAFYLGAKSVCPDVTMEVQYAGLPNNANLERIAANALIANGNVLIAQHCYTNGSAETCQQNNVYFIGCIASATDKAPDFAVTSVKFDWSEVYAVPVNCILNHESVPSEWSAGSKTVGAFTIGLNEKAFASKDSFKAAEEKIKSVEKELTEEKLHVFDTSKFTVNGEKVTSTLASENEQNAPEEQPMAPEQFVSEVEYISDSGYFKENELSSAPKFEFKIDGINILN